MKINVRMWPKRDTDKHSGSGFVVVADAIQLNFTIWGDSSKGYFVSYPGYKKADGKWQETAGPINREARDTISEAILKEAGLIGGSKPKNSSNSEHVEERREPVVATEVKSETTILSGAPW